MRPERAPFQCDSLSFRKPPLTMFMDTERLQLALWLGRLTYRVLDVCGLEPVGSDRSSYMGKIHENNVTFVTNICSILITFLLDREFHVVESRQYRNLKNEGTNAAGIFLSCILTMLLEVVHMTKREAQDIGRNSNNFELSTARREDMIKLLKPNEAMFDRQSAMKSHMVLGSVKPNSSTLHAMTREGGLRPALLLIALVVMIKGALI
ncbi:hypothetical protein VNO77_19928 [Canavalia gladiata]|uniref:Uncharacterized protein n=1 Tax=Canavalia gladiata TaxID=3824 RepID=A0AAN9LNP9_CANGL